MKSNVFNIKTKERLPSCEPRNTFPGGIFMSMRDLMLSAKINGEKSCLNIALEEYTKDIKIPASDLRTLIFVFDIKNSKGFLTNYFKDKADAIFSEHVMFE